MAKEIERKFLVVNDAFFSMASRSVDIEQGYLCTDPDSTVRVRIKGDEAFITVKSRNYGATRNEWEYSIPVSDAREMMECCRGVIKKRRFLVPYDGLVWEVDVFGGRHSGLVVAEVEIGSEDVRLSLPPFVGEEVTSDPRYYNSVLAGI